MSTLSTQALLAMLTETTQQVVVVSFEVGETVEDIHRGRLYTYRLDGNVVEGDLVLVPTQGQLTLKVTRVCEVKQLDAIGISELGYELKHAVCKISEQLATYEANKLKDAELGETLKRAMAAAKLKKQYEAMLEGLDLDALKKSLSAE